MAAEPICKLAGGNRTGEVSHGHRGREQAEELFCVAVTYEEEIEQKEINR